MAKNQNHPAEARFTPKAAGSRRGAPAQARPLRRRIAALNQVCCVFSLRRKRSAAPGALFAWPAFDAPKLESFAPARLKPDARGCFSSTRFAGKRPCDKGRRNDGALKKSSNCGKSPFIRSFQPTRPPHRSALAFARGGGVSFQPKSLAQVRRRRRLGETAARKRKGSKQADRRRAPRPI